MRTESTEAFSAYAETYDSEFTHSSVGIAQRNRVYQHLLKLNWQQNNHVLELNCGTGEDAQYFSNRGIKWTATDIAPDMTAYTQAKTQGNVKTDTLDAKEAVNVYASQNDTIFSNFGGLNCLNETELRAVINLAATKQQKGQTFCAVIMPKYCFTESLYFFFKLRWRQMFRRSRKNSLMVNVGDHQVKTYYFSPKQVKKMFKGAGYHTVFCKPVAVSIPASYLSNKVKKDSRLLTVLIRIDNLCCRISMLSGLSDHYIIVAHKV